MQVSETSRLSNYLFWLSKEMGKNLLEKCFLGISHQFKYYLIWLFKAHFQKKLSAPETHLIILIEK